MDGDPIPRVVIAAVVGALGLVVAALSSNLALRVIAIAVAALTVLLCVVSLRSRHRREAVWILILVPVLALLVGIPTVVIAGAMNGATEPRVGDPGFTPRTKTAPRAAPTKERVPANLNAALRETLDRADRLVPNGSATVLRISLRDTWISVDVFDPTTGEEVSASRSTGSDWSDARRRRANDRDTFARSEITGLDLDRARGAVIAGATELGVIAKSEHASDGITLARRYQDDKFVAEFSLSGTTFDVDDKGNLADTIGAAKLESMLPLAARVMTDAGLAPSARIIDRFGFRAFADGAPSVSGLSAGFSIQFSGGPIRVISVEPGSFPVVHRSDRRTVPGAFALADLAVDNIIKARNDLVTRAAVPRYDVELVGLEVGTVPGGRDKPAVIALQVGPSKPGVSALYTFDGRWIRDGRR